LTTTVSGQWWHAKDLLVPGRECGWPLTGACAPVSGHREARVLVLGRRKREKKTTHPRRTCPFACGGDAEGEAIDGWG
jgi:hypothetical protein